MLVMVLQKAPTSLRGALPRWMIGPATEAFLGNPGARVRDLLWEMAVKRIRKGSVVQIWSSPCPQRYRWRSAGPRRRQLVDVEGLSLVRLPEATARPRRNEK